MPVLLFLPFFLPPLMNKYISCVKNKNYKYLSQSSPSPIKPCLVHFCNYNCNWMDYLLIIKQKERGVWNVVVPDESKNWLCNGPGTDTSCMQTYTNVAHYPAPAAVHKSPTLAEQVDDIWRLVKRAHSAMAATHARSAGAEDTRHGARDHINRSPWPPRAAGLPPVPLLPPNTHTPPGQSV